MVEYPKLGRKLIRTEDKVEVLKVSDIKDFKFWELGKMVYRQIELYKLEFII